MAGFYQAVLAGQLKKGEVIVGSDRGVKDPISFRQMETDTGRERHHLKKWHDLYEAVSANKGGRRR